MSLKSFDCILCGKEHTNAAGWKFRQWTLESGAEWGWGCLSDGSFRYPEFVPGSVKEDRKKYSADMVQSHRGGELSREFVELYPNRIEGMIKEGHITPQQVRESKNVWKGDLHKSWEANRKMDASALANKYERK